MPFKKGQSGNVAGRKKGVPAKRTKAMQAFIDDIVSSGAKQFKADLKKLSPTERSKVWLTFLEFSIPKKARVEHSGPNGDTITVRQVFRIGNVDIEL